MSDGQRERTALQTSALGDSTATRAQTDCARQERLGWRWVFALGLSAVSAGYVDWPPWPRAVFCNARTRASTESPSGRRRAMVFDLACGAGLQYTLVFVGRDPDPLAFEEAVAHLKGQGTLSIRWATDADLAISCYDCAPDALAIHRWRVGGVTVRQEAKPD